MVTFTVPGIDESRFRGFRRNKNKVPSANAKKTVVTNRMKTRKLGSGQFGAVYEVDRETVNQVFDLVHPVFRSDRRLSIPARTRIAAKVLRPGDQSLSETQWLRNAMRELKIQQMLSFAKPIRKQGKVFDVSKYIPTAYFGGYVPSTGEFVIVMKLVSGKQVGTGAGFHQVKNRHQYLDIEKAWISLLLNNVLNLDFHIGNMMVTPKGQLYVIDFGAAVLLSDTMSPDKLASFKKRLNRFLTLWPKHTTYFHHGLNSSLAMNLGDDGLNQLNVWTRTAKEGLGNARSSIAKRNDVTRLERRVPNPKQDAYMRGEFFVSPR